VRRRGAETEVLGGSGGNQEAVETTRREEDDDRGKRGCGARAVRARRRWISRWATGICAEGSVTELLQSRPAALRVLLYICCVPKSTAKEFTFFGTKKALISAFSGHKKTHCCTTVDHSCTATHTTNSSDGKELKSTDLPKGKLRIAFSCSLKIQKDNCSLTKFDSIQPIRHQLLLPDR